MQRPKWQQSLFGRRKNMKIQACSVLFFAALVLVSAAPAEEKKPVEDKKHEKRGLFDLGYGHDGGFDNNEHGGFELGHDAIGGGDEGHKEHHEEIKTITIHKTIKVPVPHPVPVPVVKKVPVPYPVKVPYPVVKHYPVHVIKPYPVHVEKPVPYPVEKKVPYPVKVHVKVPVPHPYPVPVPKPVPYPVYKEVPYPVKVPVVIEKKVPVYIKHSHHGGDEGHGQLEQGSFGGFGDHEGGFGSGLNAGGEHHNSGW